MMCTYHIKVHVLVRNTIEHVHLVYLVLLLSGQIGVVTVVCLLLSDK